VYLTNNKKDLINPDPKFPEIYLTLIRLWILKVGNKQSSAVWINVLNSSAYVTDGVKLKYANKLIKITKRYTITTV